MSLREMMLRVMKLEAAQQQEPQRYTVRFSDGEILQMSFIELTNVMGSEVWNYNEDRHVVEVTGGNCPEFFNCMLNH